MTDYTVLGGHENAEFRQHDDGTIELFSHESIEGEQIGHVGNITADELQAVADKLEAVFVEESAEDVSVPELDDLEMGQHPIFGTIFLFATDDNGERDKDAGAAFDEPRDIIDAADSL
jgi:hypothetical protein